MDRTLKNYVVPAYLSCLHDQAGSVSVNHWFVLAYCVSRTGGKDKLMTRDENPKANNDNEVLIPMIVDLDSVDEHGMLAGLSKSDLRTWRVGNRRVTVALVPGTKEVYDGLMSVKRRLILSADDNSAPISFHK